jgi:hypothetical protein
MGIARNAEIILAPLQGDNFGSDGLEKLIEMLLVIADNVGSGEVAKNTAVVNISFGIHGVSNDDRRRQCNYMMRKSAMPLTM